MAGSRRFKWWIPWIGIVLVLIIGAAGVFLWKRPVAFELDDVESATVRNPYSQETSKRSHKI